MPLPQPHFGAMLDLPRLASNSCFLSVPPSVSSSLIRGSTRWATVEIRLSANDVETATALQVQSTDESVFFHDLNVEINVRRWVERYARFRVPLRDCLRTYASTSGKEQLLHFVGPFATLPRPWIFCHKLRHVKFQVGDYRNPAWTSLV